MDEKRTAFISYTHSDRERILPVAGWLVELGVDVWMDTEKVFGGDSIIDTISEAISRVGLYVVCLSPAALKSRWVIHELGTALTLETDQGWPKVIPIMVEETSLPALLVSRMYVDMTKSMHKAEDLIKKTVEHHLGPRKPEDEKHTGLPEQLLNLLGGKDIKHGSLRGADLHDVDLHGATLRGADLREADLRGADLGFADLEEARLDGARLTGSNLAGANLCGADLSGAVLLFANLVAANLDGADMTEVTFGGTIFARINLSRVKGLTAARHAQHSVIGDDVLRSSWPLPEVFLRGCGMSDDLIAYYQATLGKAIEFYSCFISYSSKDDEFAKRLHADLQDNGVRCWFAPEDLKIGDRTRVRLDESIRLHDKLLLIFSEHSVASDWVEAEVETALEKESRAKDRSEERTVLFPIRLDDAVMESDGGWAALVRNTRQIGDFTRWKEHDAYQQAFERLLRDLKSGARTTDGDS